MCPAGTFVTLGIVVRKFGVDDALIGTVATSGKFISQFVFAFAANEVVFYAGEWLQCRVPKITKSVTISVISANTITDVRYIYCYIIILQ